MKNQKKDSSATVQCDCCRETFPRELVKPIHRYIGVLPQQTCRLCARNKVKTITCEIAYIVDFDDRDTEVGISIFS